MTGINNFTGSRTFNFTIKKLTNVEKLLATAHSIKQEMAGNLRTNSKGEYIDA